MALVDEIHDDADVAFDTDALIYFVESHSKYLPVVEPVVERIYAGYAHGHISTINLLEVLVKPIRDNRPDLVAMYRTGLTTDNRMRLHSVNSAIAERAADIRARFRVEVADSIVAATAIELGCDYLITNNGDDFRKIPGVKTLVIDDYLD